MLERAGLLTPTAGSDMDIALPQIIIRQLHGRSHFRVGSNMGDRTSVPAAIWEIAHPGREETPKKKKYDDQPTIQHTWCVTTVNHYGLQRGA